MSSVIARDCLLPKTVVDTDGVTVRAAYDHLCPEHRFWRTHIAAAHCQRAAVCHCNTGIPGRVDMDWFGLDWVGRLTQFLISNHCSTVDADYDFWTFNNRGFTTLTVSIRIVGGTNRVAQKVSHYQMIKKAY